MKTLGKTFLDNFQSQATPQTTPQATPQTTPQATPAPTTPLSNKAGLNKVKVTSLQQGMLGAMSSPQGMMAQQNLQ